MDPSSLRATAAPFDFGLAPRRDHVKHEVGSAKAKFFSRFGFRLEEWQGLVEALRKQGASYPVVKTVESSYGTRYAVDGPLESPDRRNPMVRTVWLLERGSTTPRLITAYPLEEGS